MVESTEHKPKDFIPVTTNIHYIDAKDSFGQLNDDEQKYAYYMARAAWEGSKICWFQRSYESPALLVLLKLVYSSGIEKLKEATLATGSVSEEQWKQFVAYSAAVFQNCGNFKSFGDTKFVPELSLDHFTAIVKASDAYKNYQQVLDSILERIFKELYIEEDPYHQIGFRDKNGATSYYSGNVTSEDASFVDEFCQSLNLSPLNTRLFKTEDGKYELLITSAEQDQKELSQIGKHTFKDKEINVTAADFQEFMKKVVDNMQNALKYA